MVPMNHHLPPDRQGKDRVGNVRGTPASGSIPRPAEFGSSPGLAGMSGVPASVGTGGRAITYSAGVLYFDARVLALYSWEAVTGQITGTESDINGVDLQKNLQKAKRVNGHLDKLTAPPPPASVGMGCHHMSSLVWLF